MSKLRLIAPQDGTITFIDGEVGDLAQGGMFSPTVLMKLSDLSKMEVYVNVNENDIADITLNDDTFVRAGYSANGSLVINQRNDIMVIPESVLQFDRRTQQPYVEIEISDQKFERKDITIGLSDGVKVEVLSGIEMSDKIKIWNKTEPIKIEPEESAFDEFEDR